MAPQDGTADDRDDAALARYRLQVAAGAARRSPLAELPADVRPAVAVADRVGAALLPALDAADDARRHRRRLQRQVRTATAPARTVALGLVVLPLLAVPALARLLDIDLVAFYGSGTGRLVGAIAAGLWVAGAALIALMVVRAGRTPRPAGPTVRVLVASAAGWLAVGPVLAIGAAVVARMTWRAPPPPSHPDLADACDLLAAPLSAGLTVPGALREVAPELARLSADLRRLAWLVELGRLRPDTVADDTVPPSCTRLAATLADGLDAGGPLVPALRALAHDLRADAGAAAEAEALRLPTRLTFPTALCLLPATVLAIGAPIVVTGLSAFSST